MLAHWMVYGYSFSVGRPVIERVAQNRARHVRDLAEVAAAY
jgi:hypothetical protein